MLKTPLGQIVERILEAGGKIGISLRGKGIYHQKGNGLWEIRNLHIETFDLVTDPGDPSAYLEPEKLTSDVNLQDALEQAEPVFESVKSERIKGSLHLSRANVANLYVMHQHFKMLCDILAEELKGSPTSDEIRKFKKMALSEIKDETKAIVSRLHKYIEDFVHGGKLDEIISLFVDKEFLWTDEHIKHALDIKYTSMRDTLAKVKAIVDEVYDLLGL